MTRNFIGVTTTRRGRTRLVVTMKRSARLPLWLRISGPLFRPGLARRGEGFGTRVDNYTYRGTSTWQQVKDAVHDAGPCDRPQVSARSFFCLAAVIGLAAVACSRTNAQAGTSVLLTTPSKVTSELDMTGDSAGMLARPNITYTLANGTFTFTTERGELTGTYTGLVTDPTSGRPTVTMTLLITGGSNVFAGATGTLTGAGKGDFLGTGHFVLSLEGLLRTSAVPTGTTLHTAVVGTTTLAEMCRNYHIVSRLLGDGTIPTVGRTRMELESEIIETGCFED